MQFLSIPSNLSISHLQRRVGNQNVNKLLSANNLVRCPNLLDAYDNMCNKAIANVEAQLSSASKIPAGRKVSILSGLTGHSDVFEQASLLNEQGWKLLSGANILPNTLLVPPSISLPPALDVIGNGVAVSKAVYNAVTQLVKQNKPVNPSIFQQNSNIPGANAPSVQGFDGPMTAFNLPWGKISLHSSISGDSIDFPCYPEEMEDARQANYNTMPDMLYQYEPWQMYQGSGPRSNIYTFDMHRDMWTGDHRDGKANELIRFCEANCYPEYNGSAVNAPTVTLYVAGKPLISGILTRVNTRWGGPIGLDDWYLQCKLDLTITEVSKQALDHKTVRGLGLIG